MGARANKVPRNRRTAGRIQHIDRPNWLRIRPTLGRIRPALASGWIFTEVGATEVRPDSANFQDGLYRLGRVRPNLAETQPNLARFQPDSAEPAPDTIDSR